jgi:hypothetical protein
MLFEHGAHGKALNGQGKKAAEVARAAGHTQTAVSIESKMQELKIKPFLDAHVATLQQQVQQLQQQVQQQQQDKNKIEALEGKVGKSM